MIKKDVLKEIIKNFHKAKNPSIKKREVAAPINTGKIITLSGVRRSGKTFTLYEAINRLESQGILREKILFINFEDERLELKKEELDMILQAYRELYPDFDLANCYFFFDEVQNVEGWERFIRRIYDTVSENIFITGSNSRLLSKEIATTLRGRTVTVEIFPLSFNEYLTFHGVEPDIYHAATRSKIINLFEKFIFEGGFPESVAIEDTSLRNKILQEYFDVMLYRDLIERFGITNSPALKYFIKRVFENITSPASVNKIYNELKSQGYKVGKNSLYEYSEAAESIYMFLEVKKYSKSVLKQEMGEKKVYVIDNGLLNAVTFKFSHDYGKLLENLVFLELAKKGKHVAFYKEKKECDFIIFKKSEAREAIQVSHSIADRDTRNREVGGLVAACKDFGLSKGTVITFSEEDEIEYEGIKIRVVPAYKFLLL